MRDEKIKSRLGLFRQKFRVLKHPQHVVVILPQHHPGYLASTVRVDPLNQREESLSQHLLLILRSRSCQPSLDSFQLEDSFSLVQTVQRYLVGVVQAFPQFLDGVYDNLPDFLNLVFENVDLVRGLFLTGGG